MNVLITGGGGFIGSHLVDSQLAKGHIVRTIDQDISRLEHAKDHPNLEAVRADLKDKSREKELVRKIDVVYHLASAHLDISLPDHHYRAVNVEATKQLLLAASDAGVKRFVHCSSVGILGHIEDPPADEATPPTPSNIYERTKLEGEGIVLEYHRDTGYPVVVARPAWVYGPRCPRSARLIRTIKKGRFVFVGDGKTLRHPVYVSDVVQGLELCAAAENASGQAYILAGESPVTIETLVNTIARLCNVSPPRLRLPVLPAIMAGYVLQTIFKPLGRQPPLSRRSVDFFLKDNAYNISKARTDLGFDPKTDLDSGLMATINALDQFNHEIPLKEPIK